MSTQFAFSLLADVASPATLPTTPEATVGQLLVPLAFFALVAAAMFLLARQLGWFDAPRWSPPRCPTPGEAGRLWIAAAAIVLVAIAVPTVLMRGGRNVPTTLPVAPTPAGDALATLTTTGTYVAVGLAALAVHVALGFRPALRAIGLRSDRPRGRDGWVVLLGAPFAIALTTVALDLTQIVYTLIGFRQPSAHAMLLLMQRNEQTPWVLVLTIVNATLIGPIAEELLFRGPPSNSADEPLPAALAGGRDHVGFFRRDARAVDDPADLRAQPRDRLPLRAHRQPVGRDRDTRRVQLGVDGAVPDLAWGGVMRLRGSRGACPARSG